MTIEAELADGRILEFPDGTSPAVIQGVVKRLLSGGASAAPAAPAVAPAVAPAAPAVAPAVAPAAPAVAPAAPATTAEIRAEAQARQNAASKGAEQVDIPQAELAEAERTVASLTRELQRKGVDAGKRPAIGSTKAGDFLLAQGAKAQGQKLADVVPPAPAVVPEPPPAPAIVPAVAPKPVVAGRFGAFGAGPAAARFVLPQLSALEKAPKVAPVVSETQAALNMAGVSPQYVASLEAEFYQLPAEERAAALQQAMAENLENTVKGRAVRAVAARHADWVKAASNLPESTAFLDPRLESVRARQAVAQGQLEREKKQKAEADAARAKLRAEAAAEEYGPLTVAKDIALSGAKGAVDIAEGVTGLADIISFGTVGKALAKTGYYDPEGAKKFFAGLQSATSRDQQQNVREAQGFVNSLKAIAVNPAALLDTVVSSFPSMVVAGAGGGMLVRQLMTKAAAEAAALKLTGEAAAKFVADKIKSQTLKIVAATSAGEGVLTAGSTAEAGRQAGQDYETYVLPALAAGLGDVAINMIGGGVARKLGIGDIQTSMAARMAGLEGVGTGTGAPAVKVFKELAKEGFLEEMPQSYQEQIFRNLATGKPWNQGIDEAAAQGLVAGVAMAGGHQASSKILKATSSLTGAAKAKLGEVKADTREGFRESMSKVLGVAKTNELLGIRESGYERPAYEGVSKAIAQLKQAPFVPPTEKTAAEPKLGDLENVGMQEEEEPGLGNLENVQAGKEPSMAKGKTAPTAEDIEAKVNAIAERLRSRGIPRENALRIAQKQVAEEAARTQGAEDATRTEPPPSGESTSMASEPGAETPGGLETPARDGVVPVEPNAGVSDAGETPEPAALKETNLSLTTIPYETVSFAGAGQPLQRSSGESNIIDYSGRKIVLVNVNGVQVPFYLSTGSGGKVDVPAGKWYPFFGIGNDGWINKTGGKEMVDYYGSPALRDAAQTLDKQIGDIRSNDTHPRVSSTGAHIDAINAGFNPAENGTPSTLTTVRRNIDNLVTKIGKTPSGIETVEAKQAETQGQEAPAAPVAKPPKAAKPGKEVHTTPQDAEGKWGHAINGEVVETYDTKRQATAAMLLDKAKKTGNEELIAQRQKVFDEALNPQQRGRPPKIIPLEGTEKADAQAKAEADAQAKEDADMAAYEANKAKVEGIARANAQGAFDQVGEYDGDIDASVDSHRQNTHDTLEEEGLKQDPRYDRLSDAADRAFDAEVAKLKEKAKAAEKKPTAEEKFEARAKANVEANQKTMAEKAKADAEAKAKADARAEREKDEEQEQAIREKAEAEVDAGPIGEALRRIEDGDRVETKAQLRPFMFKLEKNGVLDDISDIQEALSDREQTADDVLDIMRDQLEAARDDAVDERVDELTEEAEQEAEAGDLTSKSMLGVNAEVHEEAPYLKDNGRTLDLIVNGKVTETFELVSQGLWNAFKGKPEAQENLLRNNDARKVNEQAQKALRTATFKHKELAPLSRMELGALKAINENNIEELRLYNIGAQNGAVRESIATLIFQALHEPGKPLRKDRLTDMAANNNTRGVATVLKYAPASMLEGVDIPKPAEAEQPKFGVAPAAKARAEQEKNLTAEEKERLAELDDLHINATNNPNTEGGRAAKKTLERITKDFDEPKVVRERAKAMLSGEYSTLAIQAARGKKDLAFSKFTTSSQTLSHIIKTGTDFQKRLARRLRSTVRGVKMVVVEKGQELPASVAAVKAKWDRALAMYNTEEKVVYTKGESYGRTNGLNAVVQLHELFHGATSQKIRTALAYMKMGRHLDSQMVAAVKGLQKIMDTARAELNKQIEAGTVDPDVHGLAVYGEAFTNLHEFVSYGNTDAKLQEFLKGVKGFEKDKGLFSPFVDGLRRLIGVAKEDANALSDLVQHTDQLISSRRPGGWGFPEVETLASAAIPPSPGDRTQAQLDKDSAKAWGKVDASQKGQERAAALSSLMALRDPRVIWARLEGVWDKLDNPTRKAIALTFDRNGIASTIGKHIPALHEIADRLQRMDGMAASIRAGAAQQAGMVVNFARKDRKAMKVLDRLLPASTLLRYDPANPPASGVRDTATDEAYASLKPAGQRVYREIRDYFADMYSTARDIMEASIDSLDLPADAKQKLMASIRLAFEEGKIEPYFPLMRYGDYIFRIKERGSAEYESFRFETKAERDFAARAYAKEQGAALEDLDVRLAKDRGGKEQRGIVEGNSKLLKEMYEAIDSMDTADSNAKAKLKDNMYQVYLDLMPEESVRKQFIHREEVVGFSTDTLRMINTQGIKLASALSKLQYGNELRNLSEQANRQLEGKEQYEDFVGAMDAVIDEALNPKPLGPVAGFFDPVTKQWTKFTFIHNLTSLSSALMQPADIILTASPVLVGNHGPKALVELTKMANVVKQFGVWETLPDGTKRFRAPSIAYAKGLPDIELKAIADMVGEYGLSTDTLANEIFDAATKPVNKADPKAVELAKDAAHMLVFGGLMHHTERLSREITGVVAFRLHYAEMEKASPGNPANYANAVRAAVAEANEALGDYSPGNRPQIMRGPIGKLVSTYKFFPLTRIKLLGGNFFRMISFLNKEGKIAAATKFFGILGTHSILTGVVGLPMYGIIQALWGQWQKDDDAPQTMKDLDHDTWWRTEFLRAELGDGQFTKLAKEIAKGGVLNYATGMAISERLGLDNMVFRTPDPGKNLKESVANYAEAFFGAQLTPIRATQDSWDYYSQGEYQKAFESLPFMPKSIAVLSATERISREGIETKQGMPLLDKGTVTTKELIGQALGFQSARVAEAQRIAHATDVIERGISGEKQAIVGKAATMFLKAINPNRDPEDRQRFLNMYLETFQEIPKFNVKYPEHGIDGKEIDAKINAELEKIAASKMFGGVKINDNNIRLFIQAALASREALNNPK